MSGGVASSKVVVFDLGNVVIPWDRRRALARFVDDTDEVERIAEEVFDLEANVHLDRGHAIEDVREIIERRHPGHGWVVDGYVEHFRHSLGEPITGTVELMDDLHAAGVRCVGLSNWSAICFEGILDDFPVLGRLDGVVISGEEGVCKPEPEIYRRCEERFGFSAADAFFLDDSEPNVAGALAVGWDAVVFTSPEQARRDVVSRGILAG